MRIEVSVTRAVVMDASIDAAYSALADVESSGLLLPGVLKVERLTAERFQWTLEERNVFGIPFIGRYLAQYVFSPSRSISWTTLEGNIDNKGSFQFTAQADGTLVEAAIENVIDLPVPPLLQPAVQLFVAKQVEKGTSAMLQGIASKISKAKEV